jgi:glycosyltransferase involved in cell wall biosynthesis
MRVLMIAGVAGKAEAGGAGVVYNLTKELLGLGHTVQPMFYEDLLPKPRWPARFRAIEFARQAAKYAAAKKDDFDIVNIHAPFGFWYGFSRRRRGASAGPPYVLTMHGLEERRNYAMGREAKKGRADFFRWRNRRWQNFYHMRTYRWSIETADQCIVLNRESLLFLQLRYGVPPDRVWVVCNGVSPEFFLERTYSQTTSPKFLFVGTWIDHKGIYHLVQAFEKLLATHSAVQLTIAGCIAPAERVLGDFSPSARASVTVRPFVPRAEMPALYAGHDVFVLPSLVEGMPLVLLEAMAAGLPVITTESSGMTDVVEDHQDGILTIPGDAASLLEALTLVSRDPQIRERLGCAAQEKMQRFTWKRSALRHEAVFRRALGLASAVAPETSPQSPPALHSATQGAMHNQKAVAR